MNIFGVSLIIVGIILFIISYNKKAHKQPDHITYISWPMIDGGGGGSYEQAGIISYELLEAAEKMITANLNSCYDATDEQMVAERALEKAVFNVRRGRCQNVDKSSSCSQSEVNEDKEI